MEPSNPVWNTVCQNSSTPTTHRLSSAAHSKIHLIADIEQHSTSEPQQYTATYDTLPATKLNNFTCIYNGEKSISGPVGRRLAEMRRHTAQGRGALPGSARPLGRRWPGTHYTYRHIEMGKNPTGKKTDRSHGILSLCQQDRLRSEWVSRDFNVPPANHFTDTLQKQYKIIQ